MNNTLFKNFSWSFSGSLIYALSQWVLIIIIAKIGSPYDAGVYSIGLAITAPIIMLINLNFRSLQSTDLSITYGFNSFKSTRILGILVFTILFFIIILITNYNSEIKIILFLIALNKMIESFSDLYYGLFQYHEKLELVSKSHIYRGVFGTIFFGVGYYFYNDLKIALLFMLIIWVLNLFLYDIKNGKKYLSSTPYKQQVGTVKRLIKIGLPLGIAGLIASLSVNIPRIVIEYQLSLEDLGYFSTIFYMVLIIGKFMTSLSSAILPRLARLYKNKDEKTFLKILAVVLLLLLIFSTTMIFTANYYGDTILKIAYGTRYSSYQMLFTLIMIYGLFEYSAFLFEVALNAMKYFQFRLMIEIATTLLMAISSIFLIPYFGLNGAAISLIISAILKLLLLSSLFFYGFFRNKKRCL